MVDKAIHIFLDTSVLSSAPKRENAAFGAIARLASTKDVVAHLSEVTVREFVSQEEAHFDANIVGFRKAVQDVRRRLPAADPALGTIESIRTATDSLEQQLAASAKSSLPNWLQAGNAVVHDLKPDHGARVVAAYFEGIPPFKSKKRRDDFPDAFIFAALQDVVAVHKPLHAIIADSGLRKAAAVLDGVLVYETLDDFVKSPTCQERVQEVNVRQNMKVLRLRLQNDSSILDRLVAEHLASAVNGKEVESSIIPDDNNTARITSVDEPKNITYDVGKAEYYGKGVVVVPFGATVQVLTDYFIFKGDYYAMDENRSRRISVFDGNWNDHYMAVEEYFTVRVSGTISFTLTESLLTEPELDAERITSAVAAAEGAVDEIDDIAITPPAEDT